MTNYRTVTSVQISSGTPTEGYLRNCMRMGTPVRGSTISNDKNIDPDAWYLVQHRTVHGNSLFVLYTIEKTDAPPAIGPEPAADCSHVCVTIEAGGAADIQAQGAMARGERVQGSAVWAEPISGYDPQCWFLLTKRTLRSPREVEYIMKKVDAPEPPAAPPEPTMADLLREIQVLQRMVASVAQCAHGAPLVVFHGPGPSSGGYPGAGGVGDGR